jgi:hypothetical protein
MSQLDNAFMGYMQKVHDTPLDELPPVQIKESRRCFAAGAWWMFHFVMVASNQLTEDEAETAISELEKELVDFKNAVEKGVA